MDKRIYLCLAHMSGKEMGFIQEAFDTNWVVPLGPNVSGFEQDLEAFVGENKLCLPVRLLYTWLWWLVEWDRVMK